MTDIVERLHNATIVVALEWLDNVSKPDGHGYLGDYVCAIARTLNAHIASCTDEITRLRAGHDALHLKCSNQVAEIGELHKVNAAMREALPPGRTKQDVVNLVDLALSDSLVELGNGDGGRFDYGIFVEKLAGNGLCIRALARQP